MSNKAKHAASIRPDPTGSGTMTTSPTAPDPAGVRFKAIGLSGACPRRGGEPSLPGVER
jgi:hypothetical protein